MSEQRTPETYNVEFYDKLARKNTYDSLGYLVQDGYEYVPTDTALAVLAIEQEKYDALANAVRDLNDVTLFLEKIPGEEARKLFEKIDNLRASLSTDKN